MRSLFLDPLRLERNCHEMAVKYEAMERDEVRFDTYNTGEDNQVLIVAYGTTSRICRTAIDELKAKGTSVGMVRPITLYPFPQKAIADAIDPVKSVLVVEMSMGQMMDDVNLSVLGKKPVNFFGRTGGVVPTPEEVMEAVEKLL